MAIMDTTCAMALIVYLTHPVNMDTVNQTIVKTPVVLIGFGGPWAPSFSSLSWSSSASRLGTLENIESYSTICTSLTPKITPSLTTPETTCRQSTTKTPRWLQDSPWWLRDSPWWLRDNPWWLQDNLWWLQDSLWCTHIIRLLSSSLSTWCLTQSGSSIPKTQWLSHSWWHSPRQTPRKPATWMTQFLTSKFE